MTNYCKDCTIFDENKLLKENLTIANHFHDALGDHYTELRVKMRAWGGCLPKGKGDNLQMITPQSIREFWKILGDETPAEMFMRNTREEEG